MRTTLGVLGIILTAALAVPPAYARDGDPIKGRAIFVRDNCSVCHGGRAGGGMGPNLRDNRPNDNTIIEVLIRGTPTGMPAYGNLLSERDRQNVIAYIRSLRDNDEPIFTHWWEHIPPRPRCFGKNGC